MSPDVEWQIGEGVDEEIVIKTPALLRQWRSDLIALMIVVGGGLGLIYASIQEPPARPASTPLAVFTSPLPFTDPSKIFEHTMALEKTIDVEAQALADGNLNAFLSVQDPNAAGWLQTQQSQFQAWGRPAPNDPKSSKLYFVVQTISKILPRDRATADISQYRHGVYFRETRFYRLDNDHWLRIPPDQSFWSGQTAVVRTPHFTITFPLEDKPLIAAVARRFETAYQHLCGDLNCPADIPAAPLLHLIVYPGVNKSLGYGGLPTTITLSSPRVAGLVDQSSDQAVPDPDDNIAISAYYNLFIPAATIASGGLNRQSRTGDGNLFVQAVAGWEAARLPGGPRFVDPFRKPTSTAELQKLLPLASLESLWTISPDASFFSDAQRFARAQETDSVIAFIEDRFGAAAVVNFLNNFASEKTLPEVIQATFNLSAADFEQQWQQWLTPTS